MSKSRRKRYHDYIDKMNILRNFDFGYCRACGSEVEFWDGISDYDDETSSSDTPTVYCTSNSCKWEKRIYVDDFNPNHGLEDIPAPNFSRNTRDDYDDPNFCPVCGPVYNDEIEEVEQGVVRCTRCDVQCEWEV